jgi:hypothetical protein
VNSFLIASLQVPEDRGIIEKGEIDHVLHLLKLGRIDPAHLGGLVGELLVGHGHQTLGVGILQVPRFDEALPVPVLPTLSKNFRLDLCKNLAARQNKFGPTWKHGTGRKNKLKA